MGDRLEEIKEHTAWTIDNGLQPRLDDYDLAWLINRVKELEDKTNQRYKQALEFYADEENYEPLNMEVGAMTKDGYKVAKYRSEPKIEMDKGQKARQALEGDKP